MNKLELDIEADVGEYLLKVFIDSRKFLDTEAVVLEELVKSLNGNGKYLIFTCSCGIADCGGWDKIDVEYKENFVRWIFNYNETEYEFKFEPMFYKGEIERMLFELNQKEIELSPKYLIYPE